MYVDKGYIIFIELHIAGLTTLRDFPFVGGPGFGAFIADFVQSSPVSESYFPERRPI